MRLRARAQDRKLDGGAERRELGKMLNRALLRIAALATAALASGLVACASRGHDVGGDGEQERKPAPAPEFQGVTPPVDGGIAYAPGPYGVTTHAVIANYDFQGFVNATVYDDSLAPIELADFYNPTGAGEYPDGSPYEDAARKAAGQKTPKPKALLIN